MYTERVCKRWSTNDVPFHFTTVCCCVSSQTEITHGNVAVLFSFSLVFTAIHELISCTWRLARIGVYVRTRQPLEMLNEPTVEYPFRYFFNFAVRRQNGQTSVTEKRENEFRLNVAATTRRRIYLEGIQIYTKRLHLVQSFPRAAYNSTTFSVRHGAPFTSSTFYRYRRTTIRPQNLALWNIADSICHINGKLGKTIDRADLFVSRIASYRLKHSHIFN